MENSLSHHGILGQKWGVRRYQNEDGSYTPAGIKHLEKLDQKWAKKQGTKIKNKIERDSRKEMKQVDKYLNKKYANKGLRYMAERNQYLANIMNSKVGDIPSPSGRVLRFVAKRGELGVHVALADSGYDMSKLKSGVYGNGKIAYKNDNVEVRHMDNTGYYVARTENGIELRHHGIKGQRWGYRRYQNEDGSLTPAGAKHYNYKNSEAYQKADFKGKLKMKAEYAVDRLKVGKKRANRMAYEKYEMDVDKGAALAAEQRDKKIKTLVTVGAVTAGTIATVAAIKYLKNKNKSDNDSDHPVIGDGLLGKAADALKNKAKNKNDGGDDDGGNNGGGSKAKETSEEFSSNMRDNKKDFKLGSKDNKPVTDHESTRVDLELASLKKGNSSSNGTSNSESTKQKGITWKEAAKNVFSRNASEAATSPAKEKGQGFVSKFLSDRKTDKQVKEFATQASYNTGLNRSNETVQKRVSYMADKIQDSRLDNINRRRTAVGLKKYSSNTWIDQDAIDRTNREIKAINEARANNARKRETQSRRWQ